MGTTKGSSQMSGRSLRTTIKIIFHKDTNLQIILFLFFTEQLQNTQIAIENEIISLRQ